MKKSYSLPRLYFSKVKPQPNCPKKHLPSFNYSFLSWLISLYFDCLLKRVDWFVLHLDEPLDGYDLNGGAGEESKGSVRPWDGIVQVRVRLGTAVNHAAVGKHQLVRLANVLK